MRTIPRSWEGRVAEVVDVDDSGLIRLILGFFEQKTEGDS